MPKAVVQAVERGLLLAAGLALCAALAALPARAQAPSKPVRILVGFPPGGANDIIARILAQKLGELGQVAVVENRPGANGNIALEMLARSAPDGATLLVTTDSVIVVNPHIYAKMTVDPLKDVAPVASVASSAFLFSVTPSLPVKTFSEFIEYARSANPPLAYASTGEGSMHQIAVEMLKARAGINLVHIPYKGGAAAAMATMSGEVSAMVSGASTAPQIRAGKLRGLAATGRKRSQQFPALPAIAELYPGYELSVWLGVFAPAGVPEAAMAKLRADIDAVIAMPDVKERFGATGGLEAYATTPREFADLIRTDYEKYGKLLKSIGTRMQ